VYTVGSAGTQGRADNSSGPNFRSKALLLKEEEKKKRLRFDEEKKQQPGRLSGMSPTTVKDNGL